MLKSRPWIESDREELDHITSRILLLYRRIVTSGNEDQAKEQLRSQLREKVVVDRETVWAQMVSGQRGQQGIFRSIEPDSVSDVFEPKGAVVKTPFGRFRRPHWLSTKGIIFLVACCVLVTVSQVQPFARVEESNCLAMLLFCTILWATEVSRF